MVRHLIKAVIVGVMIVVLLQFVAVPPTAWATSGTLNITTNTTLTENHLGNIVIAADNITLDCANFSVIGPGASDGAGVGILLAGRTGVTVKNCNVAGFQSGVSLSSGSSSNTFKSDSVNGNLFGFFLSGASSNTFISNTANNIRRGFNLVSSNVNTLRDNVANGNSDGGFFVTSSNGNFLKDNTANNEHIGFGVFDSSGNTLADNKGNNDLLGGAFIIAGGGNNTVTDSTATNSRVGFLVSTSTANTLSNNTATGNIIGFAFQAAATGNMITGNTANGNIAGPGGGGFGFDIADVSGNTFTQNSACGNAFVDALQVFSGTNVFFGNSFCTTIGIP